MSVAMPHGVGGEHHGRVATIAEVRGRTDAAYDPAVAFLETGAGDTSPSW
ncbi:hypothetical protein GR927_02165 [Mycolicibacterium sp. 3033]|nr:hypothetical protein [Mycolicibacterium aurantiacum]